MENNEKPYVIRPAVVEDVPFVFSSWLKSYRDSRAVSGISNTIFYANHHKVIERLIQKPYTTCLVACAIDDPKQMYGYAVCEYKDNIAVLHYCYVKFACRRFGVAKDLLKVLLSGPAIERVFYSHASKATENLQEKLSSAKICYDPYLQWGE
jgi:hypothetical protein